MILILTAMLTNYSYFRYVKVKGGAHCIKVLHFLTYNSEELINVRIFTRKIYRKKSGTGIH